MNTKELKNVIEKYEYRTFYSEDDQGYITTVSEFTGCSAFGDSPENSLKEAKTAIEGMLAYLQENKKEIPEPIHQKKYSGNFIVRISPSLHSKLAKKALNEKMSLNAYISHILQFHHSM